MNAYHYSSFVLALAVIAGIGYYLKVEPSMAARKDCANEVRYISENEGKYITKPYVFENETFYTMEAAIERCVEVKDELIAKYGY